jgi:hypothetical protein
LLPHYGVRGYVLASVAAALLSMTLYASAAAVLIRRQR